MIASYFIVVIVLMLHAYCIKLSIQARAPEAIFTWCVCFLAVLPFFILLSLLGLGWISRATYSHYAAPMALPSIATVWFLPPLEWIVRVVKANKARGSL